MLSDLLPGSTFYFAGCWNTEAGVFEVVGHDDLGYILAKRSGTDEEPSLWHDIEVELIGS